MALILITFYPTLFQQVRGITILLCLALAQQCVVLGEQQFQRYRRGILGNWFGTASNALVPPTVQRVQTINQQVPHYPIWKVHKYNGINLRPLPVSVLSQYNPVPITETTRNVPEVNQVSQNPKVVEPYLTPVRIAEPTVVPVIQTSKTEDDIKGIMKLLGLSDPSQIPSIDEVMDMLGASTQEEAIDTVKEIASTDEGVELIKSFIESRQSPDDSDDRTIDTYFPTPITTSTLSPSTTTLPPPPPPPTPIVVATEKQPFHFWSPKNHLSTASAKVASKLDGLHTNAHLLGRILPNNAATPAEPSAFRNTLRNLRNFFTFQDNTAIPVEPVNVPKQVHVDTQPKVVYVNNPIPAAPVDLPALPQLAPLPELSGVESIPQVPRIPQIQLPSHFSIPKNIVQGPYMRVKYPVSSLAPLPVYRQRPLYNLRAPATGTIHKSSYDVPIYGPPLLSAPAPLATPIAFSSSTRDAFQNAPQIVSSLPVPSLPYSFEEQPINLVDQYTVSANSPIEALALPEGELVLPVNIANNEERAPAAIENAKDASEVSAAVTVEAPGPQRLSGYEAYATGKVHRATNVDIVQSRLTKGDPNSAEQEESEESA